VGSKRGDAQAYGFVYNMAAFGGVTARLETQAAQRVFRWYPCYIWSWP
jgi:hypothetical protein